ncbi:hypothetical protein JCM14244_05290 [Venenivibrio stagnispumantis]|uniref:FlgN protein n=1 Tax=Venenivibrio stagnispumantis TaxID=407998 RepID=A0AA45WQ94_9AQUI|nr:hypothetical protein [Venenivibrio stagnispumantis]MCW4572703.1 hypothetical protein [Venenivibrio stagnispumantis]SMP22786.1 hypothetical protein SAMN06264868_1275 [Venenivibrio stagnispumantis]
MEEILKALINKLEEEKEYLIKTLADKSYIDKLLNVVEEKRELILKLSQYEVEDLKKYPELVNKLRELSEYNMQLAMNNIQFIEGLFESIFETEKTYTKDGNVEVKKDSLFNKKV